MLSGENIVCGTSTTGTGTLTLAATPVAPGGIDFDVLARATGIGFGNSAAVLVSYTIIEYTDTTFATAKSTEKGIGTLTLGGSSGIANCTLARTTVQVTATNLNSQPATYNTNAPTAFSIGTAANVLVFVGASAADIQAWSPYFETTATDGVGVPGVVYVNGLTATGTTVANNKDIYYLFEWRTPMLVKRASVRVATAYSGGVPVSNAYGRIYQVNSLARPGKLLLDLGLFGSANTSLNSATTITTALHGTGYFLTPGDYFFDFLGGISGGTTGPNMLSATSNGLVLNPSMGRFGVSAMKSIACVTSTGGTAGAAPDPANTSAYATSQTAGDVVLFSLNSS